MIKSILSFPLQVIQFVSNTINRIIAQSKNPLQSNVLSYKSLINAGIVACLIYGLYHFIEPFGINNYSNENKTILIALSAISGFMGLVISDFLLPSLFKSYFENSSWTVMKEISLYAMRSFFIGLMVMVLGNQTGLTNFNLPVFLLQFTVAASVIGVFIAFIKESMLRKKFQTKAESTNQRIQSYSVPESSNSNPFPVLVFSGSNDKVSIVPNQLISVNIEKYKSEFVYQNILGTVNKTLDISAADVLKEVNGYGQFIELDKNHFVNAQALYKAEGNGAGYLVHVAKFSNPIGVSRKFHGAIENL
ncbi:hypothetical protein [Arcticibacterium luteifluviistationis]|uniref:HTH LytTR-type domain-containing protein n=1 Tax=Arcticibacterium luteifluviistationis TaxID=1784714 RepID=A0A2Z4GA36_9BACT|nr:hypothetical protein [Arcticibacterium luteifluviistationis]AWV98109.1 hypothetical protein DJ013_07955 [Arcticibacterium luteifluviistationis]